MSLEKLSITGKIIAAYVANHKLTIEEIPDIIKKVYAAVSLITYETKSHTLQSKEPAVPIDQSVFEDYLVCLEDGRKLQILKRHLYNKYNLTLDEYKERWNLPNDYPTVAPGYAKKRTQIAKNTGLGKMGRRKAKQE